MTAKKGAAALAAGKAHMGGDNDGKGAEESAESQAVAPAEAGDNGGEDFARRPYQLDELQRTALADARHDDEGQEVAVNVDAFWRAAADRGGFNPATVEEAADFEDSGAFTAFPKDAPPEEPGHDIVLNIDPMETVIENAMIGAASAMGDVRDAMIDAFKNRTKPWDACSQGEKREIAAFFEFAAKVIVRKVVVALAAGNRPAITATLDRHTNKGGGEITGTLSLVVLTDADLLALHHATGKRVMLVTADENPHLGQRREPVGPDQPSLGFEAGTDKVAAAPAGDVDLAAGPDVERDEEDEESEEARNEEE